LYVIAIKINAEDYKPIKISQHFNDCTFIYCMIHNRQLVGTAIMKFTFLIGLCDAL